jgi:hypothetical protein
LEAKLLAAEGKKVQEASTPASLKVNKRKPTPTNAPYLASIKPGDSLLTIVKPQSNTRQIQEHLVVRLIAKIGYRWNNATSAGIAVQIVRDIVVNKNIAGYGELYDDLGKQNQKAELKMMAKLRTSHQHALANHRSYVRELISDLFEVSYDAKINFIKESVFGVADGAPIIDMDHPVVKGMIRSVRGSLYTFNSCFQFILTYYNDYDRVSRFFGLC